MPAADAVRPGVSAQVGKLQAETPRESPFQFATRQSPRFEAKGS
ncbi:hypothetical protein LJR029_006331 [Caballeronia sp. LjRoot29]